MNERNTKLYFDMKLKMFRMLTIIAEKPEELEESLELIYNDLKSNTTLLYKEDQCIEAVYSDLLDEIKKMTDDELKEAKPIMLQSLRKELLEIKDFENLRKTFKNDIELYYWAGANYTPTADKSGFLGGVHFEDIGKG